MVRGTALRADDSVRVILTRIRKCAQHEAYAPNGINNPYSDRGSPYSNNSANNSYATNAPRIYDQNGNYRRRLSTNRYDPDSVSNSYGRSGSQYSSDSINNPYGASNPYSGDELFTEE
ncbi:MAG: uncharacterized protein K0Q80_3107 [Microvirga sp.]|jgi:hypothetical protein|nr:uncharacterized protein [Microvirga sp.]